MEKKPTKKANNVRRPLTQRQEIKREVLELMIAGHTQRNICAQIADKYGLSPHGAREYVEAGRAELTEYHMDKCDAYREIIFEQQMHLYQLCVEKGDYRTATTILEKVSKLYGLQKQPELTATQTNYNIQFGGLADGNANENNNTIQTLELSTEDSE